jgi:hypothetical protein
MRLICIHFFILFQEPLVVVVSCKDILRQIITSIGATIRTAGVVKMENSKRIAWLSVEIPSKDGTRGMVRLQNF